MRPKLGPWVLRVDPEQTKRKILAFIDEYLRYSKANGIIVGMSGGLDSSLTAALCSQAVGGRKVLGITLPDEFTRPDDVKDAKLVAEIFGIQHRVIPITSIVKSIFDQLPDFDPNDRVSCGNVRVRTRMVVLYYYANRLNRLVAGTSNKSELLVGYFTKYGDGAADFMPLGDLLKTQVKQLAKYVGIPSQIIEKPPSAGMWPGQLDEEELGVSYDTLDLILYGLEQRMDLQEIAEQLGINVSLVERVVDLHRKTEHKRRWPPTPATWKI